LSAEFISVSGAVLAVGGIVLGPLLLLFLLGKKATIWLQQPIVYSFAAGTILTHTVTHMIPESMAHSSHSNPVWLIVLGFAIFGVLDKLLRKGDHHEHSLLQGLLISADSLHNFIDAVFITTAFLAGGWKAGMLLSVSILAHELPQEMAEWGVLLKSGMRFRKALLLNLVSGLFGFTGVLLVAIAGTHSGEWVEHLLLPLSAGNFLYLAIGKLGVEIIAHELKPQAFLGFGAGVLLILLLGAEGHVH
jgi:zinc and cadmium transporter